MQVAGHRIGAVLGLLRHRGERALHVVGHAQQIAGEIGGGIERSLGLFALGPLAQIVHVGGGAQQPVLEGGNLVLEHGDLEIAGVDIGVGEGGFRLGILRLRGLRLVSHAHALWSVNREYPPHIGRQARKIK